MPLHKTINKEAGMIISKNYAQRLIAAGKAKIETGVIDSDGQVRYIAITRYDVQRTDHYED